MGNFCSNCGNKLGKADNFCSNCGAKVDKSGMKQNKSIIDLVKEIIEEKKAKEKEEEQKKLKAIDGINSVKVETTYSPVWKMTRISRYGRIALGISPRGGK